nr:hypothetical protein [Candidatus Njordarchaeum guaymaensis]
MTVSATGYLRKLKEYEKKVISLLVRSGQMKTTSARFATVYAYFLTRRQLTQTQLQELTSFSSGTTSQIVNQLLSFGVLLRNNIPGSHEKQYELVGMGSVLVGSVLRKLQANVNEYRNLVATATAELETIKAKIAAFHEKSGDDSISQLATCAIPERLRRLETFVSEFSAIVPMLDRITEVIKAGMGQDAF